MSNQNPQNQQNTMPEGLTFDDGTVVRGPAPRPRVITSPQVHILDIDSDPYGETQTRDDISDGDVLVAHTISGELVTAVMVEAWPVVVSGPGETLGFHTLEEGADIRTLGSYPWGRLMTMTICPPDAERYQVEHYTAPDGGADYTASFDRAREFASNGR